MHVQKNNKNYPASNVPGVLVLKLSRKLEPRFSLRTEGSRKRGSSSSVQRGASHRPLGHRWLQIHHMLLSKAPCKKKSVVFSSETQMFANCAK